MVSSTTSADAEIFYEREAGAEWNTASMGAFSARIDAQNAPIPACFAVYNQALQEHRAQPMMLELIGHHERHLGPARGWGGPVITGHTDDLAFVFDHVRHPVEAVDTGKMSDLFGAPSLRCRLK